MIAYDMSDQMVGMSGHNLQEDPLTANYQYNGAGKRVYTNHNGRQSYPMYDAGGALRSVYKVHDGELVEQIALQNGHPLAKWTGSTLTYLHADHLGTPIRGTHGLGGTGLTPGDEVFQDFVTPYGLNPTSGWWGNADSGFDPATGPGSNCGVMGFTTHAKDCESGLQYMQARHYSPVSARFGSVDPATFMGTGDPRYVNRFAYTSNDPVNLTDPTGEWFASRLNTKFKDKVDSTAQSLGRGVVAAAQNPEEATDGVGKGIANGASNTINGLVTVGEMASPNLIMGQLPDVPRFEQGSSEAENFGMVVGETSFNLAMAAAPIGAASKTGEIAHVTMKAVSNAQARAIIPKSPLKTGVTIPYVSARGVATTQTAGNVGFESATAAQAARHSDALALARFVSIIRPW